MSKRILSLVLLGIACVWMSPQTYAQSKRFVGTKVVINFAEPTAPADVMQIVSQYGLSLDEMKYELPSPYGETIYGGYSLDRRLPLDFAIADFQEKHEAFLRSAIESLTTNTKEETDRTVSLGLRSLITQFSSLLEEYQTDGIKVSSIIVNESPSLDLMSIDSRFEKIEVINIKPQIQNEELFDIFPEFSAAAAYSWAPTRGSSKVNKNITFQVFYFSNVSGFSGNRTYEHETQVYNKNFANYANYFSTNLPSGYKDTQFLDGNIDNFTVGTPYASQLKKNTQYYTSMALSPQSAPTATVRIKGQIGHRTPSWCSSTWCIFADATTSTLISYQAPISNQISW